MHNVARTHGRDKKCTHNFCWNKTGNVRAYNVTLRRVHVTMIAVEKQ